MTRSLLPTAAWCRAALAPVLVFVAAATDRNYLADFWHHLARGRAIVEQGRLIDADLFTFTVPGRPFQDANWLSQVIYYGLYSVGGLDLVQLVNAAMLSVTLGLVVWHCRRASGSLTVAAAVSVFTFFGLWQVLTIRPQTFSLLLFVGLYLVLDAAERWPMWLLLPPFFMALWANMHGGFPIGLVLIGAFGLADGLRRVAEVVRNEYPVPSTQYRVRRSGYSILDTRHWVLRDATWRQLLGCWPLALCLLASLLATCINPYGWKVWQYVLLTSGTAASRRIDEWVPPSPEWFLGKMWLASLLLAFVAFALPHRRPSLRDVCLVVCFLPLACSSARLIAWWLLVLAPVVAAQLAAQLPEPAEEKATWSAAVFFGLLVAAVVFSLPGLSSANPLLAAARRAPRTETDLDRLAVQLPAGQAGRVFSRLEWGEYLGWSLTPRYTVFLDGRIELYPDEVWSEYRAVTTGRPEWQAILDRYDVDSLLLDARFHASTGLLPLVERSTAWERGGQSGPAVLYRRAQRHAAK